MISKSHPHQWKRITVRWISHFFFILFMHGPRIIAENAKSTKESERTQEIPKFNLNASTGGVSERNQGE